MVSVFELIGVLVFTSKGLWGRCRVSSCSNLGGFEIVCSAVLGCLGILIWGVCG